MVLVKIPSGMSEHGELQQNTCISLVFTHIFELSCIECCQDCVSIFPCFLRCSGSAQTRGGCVFQQIPALTHSLPPSDGASQTKTNVGKAFI